MEFTTNHFLYGGDYNPDQWFDFPEILEEDIRLMKKAHINTVSMAMFSWAKLEPEDGVYCFDRLESIINHLYENGISTILSTPSGARPHWLADKFPEVLRVNAMRERNLFGTRHNHCYTAVSYRQKVHDIDYALAKRFDHNPAVFLWHISNEFGGECHCPECQKAFRKWLKVRYGAIEEVNHVWNTSFWSHDYQNFDQVESPSPKGETSIHGLNIDWKRFVSHQTIDFCKEEIAAIREAGGTKPVTTNMMYEFSEANYTDFAGILDVIAWDNYPTWGKGEAARTAMDNSMQHDFMRALKKKPFLLMESCPGATNWQKISKLKRPGVLSAASLQAIAHGSDSVLYFQIRKGRGGFEKFHGAVIDHYGKEDDRTYQECVNVGESLETLKEIVGATTPAEVAVIWDTENRWALEDARGPRNEGLFYMDAVKKSYWAFRRKGINVDVIDETRELNGYKIIAAPMLYMFRPGFARKVRNFVAEGGIFILTYWSGVVNENDLCFLGGTPGGLMDVFGLRSTEIDGLYDGEQNYLVPVCGAAGVEEKVNDKFTAVSQNKTGNAEETGSKGTTSKGNARNGRVRNGSAENGSAENGSAENGSAENGSAENGSAENGSAENGSVENGSTRRYTCEHLCQLVKTTTAQAIFTYGDDFYKGTPAVTVNIYGDGKAYYICADAEQEFYNNFYGKLIADAEIELPCSQAPAKGVEITTRRKEEKEYIFV